MNYNFTDRTRKVLAFARDEAVRLEHEHVSTEHLLLGLIREGQGVAAAALVNLGINLADVPARVEEMTRRGKPSGAAELPFSARARNVLDLARQEAQELNHSYVGTEHVLLGLLREGKGIASQVLHSLGVTSETARHQIRQILSSG